MLLFIVKALVLLLFFKAAVSQKCVFDVYTLQISDQTLNEYELLHQNISVFQRGFFWRHGCKYFMHRLLIIQMLDV